MDDPAYPLAMADRAFAYDGSFRTPDAMSTANRAAYGLHPNSASEASRAFRAALHRASAGTSPNVIINTREEAIAPFTRRLGQACPVRAGVPQREAGLAALSVRPRIRARKLAGRPSSPFALFVTAADCTIRAVVWRGRVYCGGVRVCPK
jgi:hypothetical protein